MRRPWPVQLAWMLWAGVIIILPSSAFAEATGSAPSTENAFSEKTRLELLVGWGELALANGRFLEAETRFREVLQIDWNHPRAFNLLQQTRERRAQALAEWETSARHAAREGRYADALRFYEHILAERPDDSITVAAMARVRRNQAAAALVMAGLEKFILDDFAGAEWDFEQALMMNPTDSGIVVFRDRAAQKAGHASGLAELRSDAAVWAQYLDALKRFRAGDLDGAERIWRALLARFPGNESIRSNLEQVVVQRRDDFPGGVAHP